MLEKLITIMHLDGLTAFGLLAVSLMLIFYALESRSRAFVLLFAVACVMGSAYGFLQGAWPFGVVEAIWSIVALRRWWKLPAHEKPRGEPTVRNVAEFLAEMKVVARAAGRGDYAFPKPEGGWYGYVQFIIESPQRVTIHRLWTHERGHGNGSVVLRKVCELADKHRVELMLKTIPFGRKPYRMNGDELGQWYRRHGFEGEGKKLLRRPAGAASRQAGKVIAADGVAEAL